MDCGGAGGVGAGPPAVADTANTTAAALLHARPGVICRGRRGLIGASAYERGGGKKQNQKNKTAT